jgi:hypothetical protein
MYAMGLGVQVDNAQAYDWLSKAISALPEGTRRTVAEANRDAVLKRMNASQQNAVAAAKPATTTTPTAKPAATQEAASKPKEPAKAATNAAPATTKTVTEAATTSKTAATTTTTTKAATDAAATKAASNAAATTSKTAESTTKTPEKSTQVASTQAASKTPDAAPASADKAAKPTGVRIQLVSMPSEAAAWDAWKRLSGKYSDQLTGLTAMVESADLGTKGMFYRVQTGPFATVAAAQERCTAMKAAGLDCLVVGKP